MLSVAQLARLKYAYIHQNWTASRATYYSLMNGFASLILMQEFVFGVMSIVMNKIVLRLSQRLVMIPLWYGVEYQHIDAQTSSSYYLQE